MTATIISNTPPFGSLTNQVVAELFAVNQAIVRLRAAVAAASSGYGGTAGTEYEGNGTNFGVVASGAPGQKGSDYAYAVNVVGDNWNTFWTAALGSIEALDNGVTT